MSCSNNSSKCADTARQRYEGICTVEHNAFPFMHVASDDNFVRAREHSLRGLKEVWDDSNDFAAMLVSGSSEGTHEATRPTAIHKSDAVFRKISAEIPRPRSKCRIVPRM